MSGASNSRGFQRRRGAFAAAGFTQGRRCWAREAFAGIPGCRWIDAILAGEKTSDGFDYAGWLSETVQLGNVATRAIKPPKPKRGANVVKDSAVLEWDAAACRITNNPEANALRTKPYRPGWEVTPA